MSIPLNVAAVLKQHVTLEVESLDRLYLNGYVPGLQTEGGVAYFFRHHRGQPFVSSALMDPISTAFICALERFAEAERVPLIVFEKGQKKETVAVRYRTRWPGREGVYLIGKAQEKTRTFRTRKRRNPLGGKPYPWLYRSTAMVNHYYVYLVDADFGPLFIKFGSYFPYPMKVCLNGHEYLKRQLAKAGIAFEASDNCILACADPRRLQALADGLTAEKIERVVRKWLARLPHPFPAADRAAGYRYQLSILQVECSLTQVLDRPQTARLYFEQVLREHLDLGRPDQVQLIFGRRITRRTPGRFRTRVLTTGVIPSLHVYYKRSKIKQYHRDGRGLRTEATINDPHDFGIGHRLRNLPALRQVGFSANRRLLAVQQLSGDCALGEAAVQVMSRPAVVRGQRVPALRFADPRVQALFSTLVQFRWLLTGFTNAQLRAALAPLLGLLTLPRGRVTYDLRRLRLRGLIERVPHSHRYRVTDAGLRTALFVLKVHARILRPGLAQIMPDAPHADSRLRVAFQTLEKEIDRHCMEAQIAA